MTTDGDEWHRAQISTLIKQLHSLPFPPRANQIHDIRISLERYERSTREQERRAVQAKALETSDVMPFGAGDIVTCINDLISHARRTGRTLRCVFNGKELTATPDSTLHYLYTSFDEQWR